MNMSGSNNTPWVTPLVVYVFTCYAILYHNNLGASIILALKLYKCSEESVMDNAPSVWGGGGGGR